MEKNTTKNSSNVTGNRSSQQPINLFGSQIESIGQEMANRLYRVEQKVEQQEQIIDELKKQNSILEKQINLPLEFKFELIGETSLTFKEKQIYIDTRLSNWQDKKHIFLSFGNRVTEGISRGGSILVYVEDLLQLQPAKAGDDSSSGKIGSMSLGTLVVQANHINAQVNIGRTENNTLLVAANNAHAGAHKLILYNVKIDRTE